MYGLPQAGKISNDNLKINLTKFGYEPATTTPGLRWYQTCPLSFKLVVDDFGVKYERQDNTTHILDALKKSTQSMRTRKKIYTVD